jgi:hypothetical protein
VKAREFWIDKRDMTICDSKRITYGCARNFYPIGKTSEQIHVIELTPDIKRKLDMHEELVEQLEAYSKFYHGNKDAEILEKTTAILTRAKAAL